MIILIDLFLCAIYSTHLVKHLVLIISLNTAHSTAILLTCKHPSTSVCYFTHTGEKTEVLER